MHSNLSQEEISRIIDRICFGKSFVSITNRDGQCINLVIKDLSLEDRVWIDFIHKQATEDGKSNGILSEGELAIFLDEAGVWTKADEKDIQNHIISISELDSELKKNLSKRDKRKILAVKKSVESSLEKKKRERAVHFGNSLERYADQQRVRAMVYCLTYTEKNKKMWETWKDFQNENDDILISNIINAVAKNPQYSTKVIRRIARSNVWRFKWSAAKNSIDNLFGKPIVNLTNNQEAIVYWSQVYDSVYESADRPPQHVVENDEELDKWFKEKSKKRKREEVTKENSLWGVGKNIGRHSEVGIVTSRALTAESAKAGSGWGNKGGLHIPSSEEVYELNSPLSKKFLSHQNKKLKEFGVIREQDLRSDPNSRRAIGSSDVVFEKRKRRDGFTGKAITQKFQGGTLKGRREE